MPAVTSQTRPRAAQQPPQPPNQAALTLRQLRAQQRQHSSPVQPSLLGLLLLGAARTARQLPPPTPLGRVGTAPLRKQQARRVPPLPLMATPREEQVSGWAQEAVLLPGRLQPKKAVQQQQEQVRAQANHARPGGLPARGLRSHPWPLQGTSLARMTQTAQLLRLAAAASSSGLHLLLCV